MPDDNSNDDGGRKKARARQAQKRNEDVLDREGDQDDSDQPTKRPNVTATPRRAEDHEEAQIREARRRQQQDEPEETDGGDEETEEAVESTPEVEETDETGGVRAEPDREADDEELTTEPINPAASGEEWFEGLFERMKLDLEAEGSFQDPNYVFNISGDDAEELIGRSRNSPKLLSAMQTLLREALGEDVPGDILVDLGGFKEKRRSQLTGVADRLGETARNVGRSLTVAGLDKYERRIIHQRLKDVDGVDTDSVGDGVFRKLRVISK